MPPEVNSSSSSSSNSVVVAETTTTSQMDLKIQTTRFNHAEPKKICAKMANLHISVATAKANSPCPFVRAVSRNQCKDSISSLAVTITLPQELSARLDNTNIILVDCRSFMAFNKKHITGALNVNCTNPCFRRRLEKGKTTVGDLITSEEGKSLFRNRTDKEVVVYDDDSQEIENLPANHPTVLVLKSLKKEGTRASLLKGIKLTLLSVFQIISLN